MSKVVATTVLPEDSGEVLTFGDTGDAIAISGDSLNLNVLQDAGGNNIFTSDGSGNLTVPSALGGAMNLLNTNTFTGTTTSNFTTLINSTYDVYCFRWNQVHANTSHPHFTFNGSIDGGSNYNVTKTTTYFNAYHLETGTSYYLSYSTSRDLAQSTSYQPLDSDDNSDGSDSASVGVLWLFSPSGTTYVKQFYSTSNNMGYDSSGHASVNVYVGGYFNTTSAIDAISFKMESGSMDGEIKMYGISKS